MKKMRKIAYSFGAVATALSYQAFSTYFVFFYTDVMKLLPWLVSAGMLVYGIWNAVNDPLAGFVSDITRTRIGRRIPFILFGTLPFALCYFLVWVPPVSAATMALLFIYFLIIINLFDTLYTVVSLNWAALYPEMYPELEERAQVNTYRQVFQILGFVIGIALPPLIYGTLGWGWMGALLGTVIAVSLYVSLLGSKEKKEFSMGKKRLGFKDAISYTFNNKSFLTFVFANLFVQYTFVLLTATIPFYTKYVLGVGSIETFLVLFTAFAAALPVLFLWRKLVMKIGAKNCYLASIVLLGLALAPFLLIKTFAAALVVAAFIGIGLSGILLIWDVIISDIIDEDELRSGVRREGMYFGMNSLVVRFAIAMQAATIGLVLTFSGYQPALSLQPDLTILGFRLLIAGIPVLGLAAAFMIMRMYPLFGERLAEVEAEIRKRRVP